MQATELIAVSIPEKHPSGSRRRCGFEFTTVPSVAEVTPEEKAIIKSDPYMTVHRRLSLSWFKAFKLEHTKKNEDEYAKEDPADWRETANVARLIGEKASTPQPEKKTAQKGKESKTAKKADPKKTAEENKPVVNNFSSKEAIVAELEKLGLKAGTDFEPDATRKVLLALYNSKLGKAGV